MSKPPARRAAACPATRALTWRWRAAARHAWRAYGRTMGTRLAPPAAPHSRPRLDPKRPQAHRQMLPSMQRLLAWADANGLLLRMMARKEGATAISPSLIDQHDVVYAFWRDVSTESGLDTMVVKGRRKLQPWELQRRRFRRLRMTASKLARTGYYNKRTEMYFPACKWIRDGGALPDCPELVGELSRTHYTLKGDCLLLEDNASIKASLGRSPDHAVKLTAVPAAEGRAWISQPSIWPRFAVVLPSRPPGCGADGPAGAAGRANSAARGSMSSGRDAQARVRYGPVASRGATRADRATRSSDRISPAMARRLTSRCRCRPRRAPLRDSSESPRGSCSPGPGGAGGRRRTPSGRRRSAFRASRARSC